MAAMYRHFQAAPAAARGAAKLRARYQASAAGGRARLTLGDSQEWLEPGEAGQGYAYERILYTLASRVQSHFLVHAGAVARGDQGVILAADAAHGKTTLVLELLRRGWRFLSDEMAALSFSDGRLYSFPRALRLREDTLARVGLPPAGPDALLWLGKRVVDVEDLLPGQQAQSAALAQVIILADADPPRPSEDLLVIRVDRATPDFVAHLRQLPNVVAAAVASDSPFPLIELRANRRMLALNAVENLCRNEGVQLVDVIKRPETPAKFTGPARLEPLAHSEAVIELLRRFQGGHHSALLEKIFAGQTTQLFQAVARLIAGAGCHQLVVGDHVAMADLVEGLVRS